MIRLSTTWYIYLKEYFTVWWNMLLCFLAECSIIELRGDKREKALAGQEFTLLFLILLWWMVQTECHDVCLWECCFVTSGVAHRFPTISTQPLIRHLAFSLVQDYSLCELPLPLSIIGDCVCVWVCLCVSVPVFLHPYGTHCDSIKPDVFSMKYVNRYTALCCVCTYICVYVRKR